MSGVAIVIGQYIDFADKGNVLTVSLSVSANTDFHIGIRENSRNMKQWS